MKIKEKKQVDALKTLEPKEVKSKAIQPIDYGNYYIDRMVEIRNQFKRIDFNNLTYFYKGNIAPIKFIGFKGMLHIFKSIYNGSIPLADVEK